MIRHKLIHIIILLTLLSYISCQKDKLDIQQDFPFQVQVMPVPKEVSNGKQVEIRIQILRKGNYNNTQYFIRYFQFDGQGSLHYFEEPPYKPNDLYKLREETFRLYYTSASSVSQSFDIWISDSFGNEKQLSFKFNSED